MCALRQTLLALGLVTALFAPAARAQQRLHLGAPPPSMPMHGPQQFGQPEFGRPSFPQQQDNDNDDDSMPMSDSVRRAQQLSGGRVIGTDRVQYDGRAINRVKVIDSDGRVRYIDDNRQVPRHDGGNHGGPSRQFPQNAPQTP